MELEKEKDEISRKGYLVVVVVIRRRTGEEKGTRGEVLRAVCEVIGIGASQRAWKATMRITRIQSTRTKGGLAEKKLEQKEKKGK